MVPWRGGRHRGGWCAGVVAISQSCGQACLVAGRNGTWGFPKGGAKGDDGDMFETAVREWAEETQLDVDGLQFEEQQEPIEMNGVHYYVAWWILPTEAEVAQTHDGDASDPNPITQRRRVKVEEVHLIQELLSLSRRWVLRSALRALGAMDMMLRPAPKPRPRPPTVDPRTRSRSRGSAAGAAAAAAPLAWAPATPAQHQQDSVVSAPNEQPEDLPEPGWERAWDYFYRRDEEEHARRLQAVWRRGQFGGVILVSPGCRVVNLPPDGSAWDLGQDTPRRLVLCAHARILGDDDSVAWGI